MPSLIGNKPNQVPSNGDLGSMAFLDYDALFASGIYTPEATPVTNVASVTMQASQFMRVGNVVTVSGQMTITTSATGAYLLRLSLPIPSNISATQHCSGVAAYRVNESAGIYGSAANNEAVVEGSSGSTAARSCQFTFTYRIIL
jgi:hypothetical protein